MKTNGGTKKRWRILGIAVCLTMALTLAFGACAPADNDDGKLDPSDPSISQPENPDENGKKPDNQQKPGPEVYELTYRSGVTPERFSDVKGEVTDLAEGVHLVKNTMTLSNGNACVVWTVEVNLNYAGVVAGTKNNVSRGFNWEKATPYAMAEAWEKATGGQVYASINADFFGEYSVNAFVKDGYIIKAGHNDKGGYDYKNLDNDVPASAPMLFGINGTTAQIAPIIKVSGDPTTAAVKEQLIKAELYYKITSGSKKYVVKENAEPSDQYITLHTLSEEPNVTKSGTAVKVDTSKGFQGMKVLEKLDRISASTTGLSGGDGYAWLLSTGLTADGATYLKDLKVGDTVSLSVASSGGTWDDYDTILGTRQALVVDGAIASTVALENSNGAQTKDIPRTAVGIKDGRVVLFAVESMYYYKKDKEGDTHGMNLPELAEFAYYYGCDVAANFDGGGSTQLVVRGEGETEAKTVVRSADYGTWGIKETRVVMNGFLITSKKS